MSKDSEPLGPVAVKISNASHVALRHVTLTCPAQTLRFGDIAAGDGSDVQRVLAPCRPGKLEVEVAGEQVSLALDDHPAGQFTRSATYTYALRYRPEAPEPSERLALQVVVFPQQDPAWDARVDDVCAIGAFDTPLCRVVRDRIELGMRPARVRRILRDYPSWSFSAPALAYFDREDEGPIFYLGFYRHDGGSTHDPRGLEEVLVTSRPRGRSTSPGLARYMKPSDSAGRRAYRFRFPKKVTSAEAWRGGPVPRPDQCPWWKCIARYAHDQMTPEQIEALGGALSTCFEQDSFDEKNAMMSNGCLPRVVGKDARNGLTLEVYFACEDVCPAYGGYGIRYRGVAKDDCGRYGGRQVRGSGWGSYFGCKPPDWSWSPDERTAADGSRLPKQPSRDQVVHAMRSVEADVRQCPTGPGDPGVAIAALQVAGESGEVQYVKVSDVPPPTAVCIEDVVRRVRFPRFRQDTFHVRYPYRLGRRPEGR